MDRFKGLVAHFEVDGVPARVVAHRVEVGLRRAALVTVELRREGAFLADERAGLHDTRRIHQHAPARGDVEPEFVAPLLGHVVAQVHRTGDDERPRLEGVLPDRGVDVAGLDGVGGLGAGLVAGVAVLLPEARPERGVDLLAVRTQCGLREGHVVLVADQPAESPEVGVVGPQAGRVASAPDFPLLMGWHQFAMASHQVAVAVEVEHRVVECFAAGSVVEFVRSEDDVAVRIVDGIAEYLDGLVVDAEAVLLEIDHQVGPARNRHSVAPVGVPREVRLRERDEVDPFPARALDPLAGLVEGPLHVVVHRLDLCRTERKRLFRHVGTNGNSDQEGSPRFWG
jgi:hypothetical protein